MQPIIPPTKVLDSLLLMQIVHEGSSHGYAIGVEIEEKFGWKPSQTAIYNSLKSLEEEGLVTSKENIESGRVQKIYSATKKGVASFDETNKKMKEHMKKNFKRFFSVMQMLGDIGSSSESEEMQQLIHDTLENTRRSSDLIITLLKEAPEETGKLVEEHLNSLKKIAEKFNIKIPE